MLRAMRNMWGQAGVFCSSDEPLAAFWVASGGRGRILSLVWQLPAVTGDSVAGWK